MRVTLEKELKFDVDGAFAMPELDGETLDALVFTSTYFDTADRRLLNAGLTLRRRVTDRRGLWQLKLPVGADRHELEQPGGPAGPPREITDLIVALTQGRGLTRLTKLRTRRSGVRVRSPNGTTADVLLDDVSVLDDRRVVDKFREVEIEVDGDDDDLVTALRKELRRAGAKARDLRPKLVRVIGPPEVPGAGAPALAGEAEHVRQAIAVQVHEINAHDPGVRLGIEPEDLHDMRVAVRRLRAFLRATHDSLEPEWYDDLRGRLKWLGGELGPVRDLDVLIDHLEAETERLEPQEQRATQGFVTSLAEMRDDARSALAAALRSDAYFELLDVLDDAVRSPRITGDVDLRAVAAKAYRKLKKAGTGVDETSSDDEIHSLRILGKRARYAAELAEPVVGKPAARFLRRAKAFQDVLGSHQDAVVAEAHLRRLARGRSGTVLLATGRLIERERARREHARSELAAVKRRLLAAGKRAFE
ncbi:MAG TPA: CYTH and CHAD domain-containing protein [Gaiellaceae bacterium]